MSVDEAGALMVWDAVYEYAEAAAEKAEGNQAALAYAQMLSDRAQAEAMGR